MKLVNLSYEEAKNLLLQGHPIKLPNWLGYWKLNLKTNEIEVHLKTGKIIKTPNAKYTLQENWELATEENCPVLKKEKEKSKKDMEIIETCEVYIFGSHILAIKFKEGEEIRTLPLNMFIEKVGFEKTNSLMTEYFMKNAPDKLKPLIKDVDDATDNLIKTIENRLLETLDRL